MENEYDILLHRLTNPWNVRQEQFIRLCELRQHKLT